MIEMEGKKRNTLHERVASLQNELKVAVHQAKDLAREAATIADDKVIGHFSDVAQSYSRLIRAIDALENRVEHGHFHKLREFQRAVGSLLLDVGRHENERTTPDAVSRMAKHVEQLTHKEHELDSIFKIFLAPRRDDVFQAEVRSALQGMLREVLEDRQQISSGSLQ